MVTTPVTTSRVNSSRYVTKNSTSIGTLLLFVPYTVNSRGASLSISRDLAKSK